MENAFSPQIKQTENIRAKSAQYLSAAQSEGRQEDYTRTSKNSRLHNWEHAGENQFHLNCKEKALFALWRVLYTELYKEIYHWILKMMSKELFLSHLCVCVNDISNENIQRNQKYRR